MFAFSNCKRRVTDNLRYPLRIDGVEVHVVRHRPQQVQPDLLPVLPSKLESRNVSIKQDVSAWSQIDLPHRRHFGFLTTFNNKVRSFAFRAAPQLPGR